MSVFSGNGSFPFLENHFAFPIPIQSEIMIRVNRSLGSASTCNSILWVPVYKDNVA